MSTALSGSLRLRPTRIGFLVDPADMTMVRQAMQLCTCLWGGAYNPIIPVCRDDLPPAWKGALFSNQTPAALANGYIEFFEPDVFVEGVPGLAAGLNIRPAEFQFHKPRVVPMEALLKDSDDENRPVPPVGLSVRGLYRALYESEFRFVQRDGNDVAYVAGCPEEDEPFVDAVFGTFPKVGMLAPLLGDFTKAFEPRALQANAAMWLEFCTEGLRFPLYFTRHNLERAPAHGSGEAVFFVADPSSPLDLVDLWNLRLFRRHVIPVNLRWLAELTPFMREFIEGHHRPLSNNPHGVMTRTMVQFGRSIGEFRARELVEQAGLTQLAAGSWGFDPWYYPIWHTNRDDYSWQPRRARITAKSQDLELNVIDDNPNRRAVRFPTLAPDFAERYTNSDTAWVNVLRLRQFTAEPNLALSLPNDFDPLRTRHLRTSGVILPSREGLVLVQKFPDHGEYITLLTGHQALTDWLDQHGIKGEISSSGRVTEQVIASVEGLRGTKLIAHGDTVRLLDDMAKSVKRYTDGTVEEYADRTAPATVWESLIARRAETDIWSHHMKLDHFVESKILKLGLSIKCSHCAFTNWYAIGEVSEELTCERCLKVYAFPQGSIGYTNSPWKFRVIGPFSVPNFADGAYATALALRVFAHGLGSSDTSVIYTPGITLKRGEGAPIEIDFGLWYRRDDWIQEENETVTIFGEAKSFGSKCFHSDDIKRMRTVAEAFPGAFLVFAALKSELHEDEKASIREFAQWGREPLDDGRPRSPVIVLTGTELFAGWHVPDTWKDLAGSKQARFADHRLDNPWTLADVTQQLYLDMPSHAEDWHRRHQESRAANTGQ